MAAVLIPMIWMEIDCDSVFYISMVERVAEGKKLYVDVSMAYTPLWVYIAAGLKTLLHIPSGCYLYYQLLHLCFLTGVAALTGLIGCAMGAKKEVALFGSWFVIMASMLVNGHSILLEIPSLFFGLMSLWLILREGETPLWYYLPIGMLSACAFLAKQYGFGFIALDLLAMILLRRRGWRESVLFLIGYAIPIAICLCYWGEAFLNATLMNGYGTTNAAEAGWDTSLRHKLMQIVNCLLHYNYWICPMLVGGLFYLRDAHRQKRGGEMLLAYCGLLGFGLQFYFSAYDHYMLYLVPFGAMLTMIVLTLNPVRFRYFRMVLLAWMIVVPIGYHFGQTCYREMIGQEKLRSKQYAIAEQVRTYIPHGETVWVGHYGLFFLYLTNELLPPNLSTIGYSFGAMGLNEQRAFEQSKNAQWVVRNHPVSEHEPFYTDSLLQYLNEHETIYLNDSSVVVHNMQSAK